MNILIFISVDGLIECTNCFWKWNFLAAANNNISLVANINAI